LIYFVIYCVSGLTASRPLCNQLYNIFYSSHPSAMRIEPMIHQSFKHILPVNIPRYHKYPYGDSTPMYASRSTLIYAFVNNHLYSPSLVVWYSNNENINNLTYLNYVQTRTQT